jgi:hypothetical protein
MSAGLRKRKSYFVQIPSSTIREKRLSFRARGLLTFLLDMPDGWDVKSEVLAAWGTEGRDAIRKALFELAQFGYYRLERRRLRDGRQVMGTAVSETPVESWIADHAEFSGDGNTLKPVPVIEVAEGVFKVRHKDGRLTDDGFTPKPPRPDDTASDKTEDTASDKTESGDETGAGFSGPGAGDGFSGPGGTGAGFPGAGEPGAGKPVAGEPVAGISGPLRSTETYDREVISSDSSLRSESANVADATSAPPQSADESTAETDELPLQPTLTGLPGGLSSSPKRKRRTKAEKSAEEQLLAKQADEVAKEFWPRICQRRGPYAGGYKKPVVVLKQSVILPGLRAGLTQRQVYDALLELGEHIPSHRRWQEKVSEKLGYAPPPPPSLDRGRRVRVSNLHIDSPTAVNRTIRFVPPPPSAQDMDGRVRASSIGPRDAVDRSIRFA